MPILGAHQSIAGGYYRAVEIAHGFGCDCVQLFTKNNSQWRAKEITTEEADQFRASLKKLKIKHPIAHNSYLINLASPDAELWKKSIDSFVVELLRAEQLGLAYVVSHPGAHTTSSEQCGLQRIIEAINEVHAQTCGIAAKILLENTAGQGSCLGCKFEQLAMILEGVADPDRMGGICFDTCHAFAAGYPLSSERDYLATMKQFESAVGLKRIKAFHLNDSKKAFGSRVDRHDHIGRGQLGLEAFRLLLNDRRFRKVPMYLETPKGQEDGVELDAINLRTLRELVDE
jgi:deoxyribonuclease-4